jgi:hypothetical protein
MMFPPKVVEFPPEVTTTTDEFALLLFAPRERFLFRFGFENPPPAFCAPGDR